MFLFRGFIGLVFLMGDAVCLFRLGEFNCTVVMLLDEEIVDVGDEELEEDEEGCGGWC